MHLVVPLRSVDLRAASTMSSTSTSTYDPPSLRIAFARAILDQGIRNEKPDKAYFNNDPPPTTYLTDPPTQKDMPIGIVGAGAAGLAVAICLQIAGYTNVEILEADPHRVGGRCYTFRFADDADCPHNYYDVGAMRIPPIPTMKSTFNWIDYLNKRLPKLQKPQIELKDHIHNAYCEPSMYYYSPIAKDPERFYQFMMNPEYGILAKNGFLDPTKDFDTTFKAYMDSEDRPDQYSTRSFLMHKASPNWKYEDTEVAETFNTSTGLFDQAFMETICDYFDFQAAQDKIWKRVEGGMSKLTDAMSEVAIDAGAKIILDRPVFSMSASKPDGTVTVKHPSGSATYNALFTTTTLGALQRMDLSGLGLSQNQLTAIRALSYDRATKVAIKFSGPWWHRIMPKPKFPSPPPSPPRPPDYTFGGVSSSDLSISNVVYPSWYDGEDKRHTIIVSYSWAQDATRMASLIADNNVESTNHQDPLITLIFAQLQLLWSSVPAAAEIVTPANLSKLYISHHAFSWAHDPHATGGFALFGPGQFSCLYNNLTAPLLDNKFMVCGEAISVHHAWISGALDSAYNAVWTWLQARNDVEGSDLLTASRLGQGKGQDTAELDPTMMKWKIYLTQQNESNAK